MEEGNKNKLRMEIADSINRVSGENESNTPDFILANYLMMCLETFDNITKMRDEWYGVHLEPGRKYFIEDK